MYKISLNIGRAKIGVVIFIVVASAAALLVMGKPSVEPQGSQAVVVDDPHTPNQQNLQLKKLILVTVTPAPTQIPNSAPVANTVPNNATPQTQNDLLIDHAPDLNFGNPPADKGPAFVKDDKPVIFLYPTHKTIVNVAIKTSGYITVSDPLYATGGWKKVEAKPDGSLKYNNHAYSELFYETSIMNLKKPRRGISIETTNLYYQISDILVKLGLNAAESKEFLEYWVPKLTKLNSPYIFFSLIEPDEKERIDHIDISPSPDTKIEILAYFKALQKPLPNTLALPSTPPQRIGFTMVEWGGILDSHSQLIF